MSDHVKTTLAPVLCGFSLFQKVKCLEYSSLSRGRWVLCHDQTIKWAKAKVCVYADSVLCVGQMEDSPGAIEKMGRSSGRTQDVSFLPRSIRNRWRTNWIRVDCFPGFSSLGIILRIQEDLARKNIKREEFTDRIIFMSMFNDINWSNRENDEKCISNAEKSQGLREEVLARTLDVSWSWIGKEEVWWIFLLHSQWNGTAIQGNRSPCILKHWCLESWHPQEEER